MSASNQTNKERDMYTMQQHTITADGITPPHPLAPTLEAVRHLTVVDAEAGLVMRLIDVSNGARVWLPTGGQGVLDGAKLTMAEVIDNGAPKEGVPAFAREATVRWLTEPHERERFRPDTGGLPPAWPCIIVNDEGCAECGGAIVATRGRGLDTQVRVCSQHERAHGLRRVDVTSRIADTRSAASGGRTRFA